MKKKYLYSLLVPYLLSVGTLTSCEKTQAKATTLSKHNRAAYVYKKPALNVRIDTLNLTDENFKQVTTTGAAGLFIASKNTVIVYHFNAATNTPKIVNYCNYSNNRRPLYMRHELEHARKRDLVHNTGRFSAVGRAEVAAMNEIVAPAAEIIEAVDYHARTGKPFPYAKPFIARADSAITSVLGPYLPAYVNYNYQPVADIVLKYAMEDFFDSVERGYYKYAIHKAYDYKPALIQKKQPNPIALYAFDPDLNQWDPLWTLESKAGLCNPYKNASRAMRNKLIQKVDSLVCDVTGADKNALILKYAFLR